MTLKSFWKTVGIEENPGMFQLVNFDIISLIVNIDGFNVTLDRRTLRTPNGKPLTIPSKKRLAATLIANEWDNQEKVLKPHALPVVSASTHRYYTILTYRLIRVDKHRKPSY